MTKPHLNPDHLSEVQWRLARRVNDEGEVVFVLSEAASYVPRGRCAGCKDGNRHMGPGACTDCADSHFAYVKRLLNCLGARRMPAQGMCPAYWVYRPDCA